MKQYQFIIEYCSATQLYIGYVPGFSGAHSQGETIEQLKENLTEVIEMLHDSGSPEYESTFIGMETISVN